MMQSLPTVVHLRSTRSERLYRVVAIDPDNRVATLKGQHGTFVEPWDRERLQAIGYERINGPFDGMIEIDNA